MKKCIMLHGSGDWNFEAFPAHVGDVIRKAKYRHNLDGVRYAGGLEPESVKYTLEEVIYDRVARGQEWDVYLERKGQK